MRNYPQGFALDETEFQQAQTDIATLVRGYAGTHIVHDDVYIRANAT
jgi:hypothetical protein